MLSSLLGSSPGGEAEAVEGDGAGASAQPQPYQRTERIRNACQVDPALRTDKEIEVILAFVATVSFFPQLTRLQQQNLCQCMTLETHGTHDKVITRGERGDKFYIILSGSVAIQVPRKDVPCQTYGCTDPDCTCPNRLLETVNFLHPGTGFGDLALQSDEPRRATVVCSESSEFLVITRADYQSYADARHREFLSERVEFLRSCPCIRDALLASSVTEAEVAVMANLLHEVCLHGHVIACKQGDEVSEVIFVRSGQLLKIRAVDVAAAGSIAGNPRSPSQADQAKMQELFTVKRTARRTSAMEKLDTDMLDPQSKSSAGSKEQAQPRQPGQAPAAAASKWAVLRREMLQRRLSGAISGQDAVEGLRKHLEKHANKPDAIETSSEAPTTAGNGGRHMLLSVGFVGPFERFGDRELFLGERHAVSLISNPVAKLYTMKRHDILKLPKRLLSELFGQQALCLPDDRQLLAMYRRGKKWDHFRKGVHVQHRRGVDADSNLEFLGASGGAADVDRASDRRPPADSRRVGLTLEEAEDFSQSPASFLHRFHGMRCDRGLRDHCARRGLRYEELGRPRGEADIGAFQLERQWSQVRGGVFADLEADLDEAAELELARHHRSPQLLPPRGRSPRGGSSRGGSRRGGSLRGSSSGSSGSGSPGGPRPPPPGGGPRRPPAPQPPGPRPPPRPAAPAPASPRRQPGGACVASPARRVALGGQWALSPRRRPQPPRRGAPAVGAAQVEASLLTAVAATDGGAWRLSPRSARQKGATQPRGALAEAEAPFPAARWRMLPLIAREATCFPGSP